MDIQALPLSGLKLITPSVHADRRGYFIETWQHERYAQAGIPGPFVQDNRSHSSRGTLRGLHYQLPHEQGKLIHVAQGRVFDVAVDIRRGSSTFGQWHGIILDDQSHQQFYVPPGFAHGFLVLSETADFVYKCTDSYHPEAEHGILWSDADLAIAWPADGIDQIVVSDRDASLPLLNDISAEDLPVF